MNSPLNQPLNQFLNWRVIRLIQSVCLLCLSAMAARGQLLDDAFMDIRPIAPGVRLWTIVYNRKDFQQKIDVIEIQGGARPAPVLAGAAGRGLWEGEELQAIALREKAVAAWTALPVPPSSARGQTLEWPGLTVLGGRLTAAPGQGPVVAIAPEGFAALLDSGSPPENSAAGAAAESTNASSDAPASHSLGKLILTEGAEIPISWINRPEAGGGAGLLADARAWRERFASAPGAWLAEELSFQAAPRLPRGDWEDVSAAGFLAPWASSPEGTFTWRGQSSFDPASWADPFPMGWTGIIASPAHAAAFAQRQEGRLEIQTVPRWSDYETILPLGNWLVRERMPAIAPPSPAASASGRVRMARSAVARDPDHSLLWLALVHCGERGADGMTEMELVEFLLAFGAVDAAQGPSGDGAAVWTGDSAQSAPREILPKARAAMIIRDASRSAPRRWRNLLAADRVYVSGSKPLDLSSGPEKTLDARQGRQAAMDHFWASAGGKDQAPYLDYDFALLRRIGQIDLVFAEEAGFSPQFNAKAVKIFAQTAGSSEWKEVLTVRNEPNRPRRQVLFEKPLECRRVRLEFTEPNFLPGNSIARLVEAVFWTESIP